VVARGEADDGAERVELVPGRARPPPQRSAAVMEYLYDGTKHRAEHERCGHVWVNCAVAARAEPALALPDRARQRVLPPACAAAPGRARGDVLRRPAGGGRVRVEGVGVRVEQQTRHLRVDGRAAINLYFAINLCKI
jgi:hypothetical protein